MFGSHEGRHHGIANRFHDGAFLGRNDFQQGVEMRTHQIEGGEIADPLIKRGGALEVGEQKRQRGDLEPLVDVEICRLL